MAKEGYWISDKDKRHRVYDHAQWAFDRNLVDKDMNPNNDKDRIKILLALMNRGWIRVRGHGNDITFEFSKDTNSALWSILLFLKKTGMAGTCTQLTINNLRTRDMIGVSYGKFEKAMKTVTHASQKERVNHMKKFLFSLIFAALLSSVTAEEKADKEFKIKHDVIVCQFKGDYSKLLKYISEQDDTVAFIKASESLLENDTATILKKGEVVFIMRFDKENLFALIRRKGQIKEFWIHIVFLER